MKKSLLIILSMMFLTCIVSCSFSEQENNTEDAKSLIKVSFVQKAGRALSAKYSNGLNLTMYLTAEPKFTRGSRTIVGTVEEQKISPDEKGDFEAGYFEQGKWDFTVDAYIENSDSEIKTKVATQTVSDFYISEKNNIVVFELSDVAADKDAKGNVSVSIKVPKISSSKATLKVKVDGTDTGFKSAPVQSESTDGEGTDLIQFDALLEGIAAGCHELTFSYYVENPDETDETKKDVLISSEILSVRVVEGTEISVSGTMMNEKYAKGSFNVVIASEAWSAELSPENATIVQQEEKTFSCTVSGTKTGDSISYKWYVDGSMISGETASSFKFKTDACGIFSITCLVKVNDVSKSFSTYVLVGEKKS